MGSSSARIQGATGRSYRSGSSPGRSARRSRSMCPRRPPQRCSSSAGSRQRGGAGEVSPPARGNVLGLGVPGGESMRAVFALAAVAGLAAAAPAQTFTPRVGFRNDHTANATPTGNEATYLPGSIPIQVLFGAFNAQGFSNRGMFNFIGTATMTDPLGDATFSYRTGVAGSGLRSPYNFGGVEMIQPGGTTL